MKSINFLSFDGLTLSSFESFSYNPFIQSDCKLPRYELQLFAAEDEGRTELPSERRKREERAKGNIPKSQDATQSLILIGGALSLLVFAPYMFSKSLSLFRKYFDIDYSSLGSLEVSDVRLLILMLFVESAKIVFPIMLAVILMGVIGNVAQVGAFFSLQPLAVNFKRIVPDFKRVLPNRRTMYALAKTIVQTLLIGFIAYTIIVKEFIPMLKGSSMEMNQAIFIFAKVAFDLLIAIGFVMLALSVVDYFYQKFEYLENLKVTIAEAKRERRDEDGDPMIRRRQRERMYELKNQMSMLQAVPEADVVVTNPTHYAVALKYDPSLGSAPVVTAKGEESFALRIRMIAKEHRIPIEENPFLARTLYDEVELNKEIPATLYRVVSLIFSRLEKFRRTGTGG